MKRTRVRLGMLALISVGTMINYLDRAVLGVAAPSLTQELGLSAAVMGIVFSAFSWTYATAQIPGGILLDRFGTRIIYFLSVGFWSVFTLLMGLVSSLAGLIAWASPRRRVFRPIVAYSAPGSRNTNGRAPTACIRWASILAWHF
jgi:MFS transporter, ACS family, D-galactonate transporter